MRIWAWRDSEEAAVQKVKIGMGKIKRDKEMGNASSH